MSEIITVKVSKLKQDETINNLVPRMSDDEWQDFLQSVKEDGIRQPIDVNNIFTVLDGRHRVDACLELGINEIEAHNHELSDEDVIKFVRDTAVKRRNLTKPQVINILHNSYELIKGFEEQAKENKRQAMSKAAQNNPRHQDKDKVHRFSGNQEKRQNPIKPVNTTKEKAKLADTSEDTIWKSNTIRKENPELYEQWVNGEIKINTAYQKLASVQERKRKKEQQAQQKEGVGEVSKSNKHHEKTEKGKKVDIREQINARADALTDEEYKGMQRETNVRALIDNCDDILDIFEEIDDLNIAKSMITDEQYKTIAKAKDKIIELLQLGGVSK